LTGWSVTLSPFKKDIALIGLFETGNDAQ